MKAIGSMLHFGRTGPRRGSRRRGPGLGKVVRSGSSLTIEGTVVRSLVNFHARQVTFTPMRIRNPDNNRNFHGRESRASAISGAEYVP